jgi:hypothetical protein
MRPTKSHNKQRRISGHRGYAFPRREIIVGSIRPCLENPGVWGKAPAAAHYQTRHILWNNPADITTKAAPNYDQSLEIST